MKEERNIVGKTLKDARTSKKISFEKASKETKISQTYLKAMEEEDFDKIPGEVVLKGFLKIYADFLGVDSNALISELNKKIKKDKPKNDFKQEKKVVSNSTKKLPSLDLAKASKMILVVSIVIVLLVGIFSFVGFFTRSLKSVSNKKNNTTVTLAEKNTAIKIKAEIIEKTWLLVISDGRIVFKGIASPNQEKIWTADKRLQIKVGNAAGIKLFSGEKEIMSPGQFGQVVYKEFVR